MKTNPFFLLLFLLACSVSVYSQKPAVTMPTMIHVEGGSFMMGNNAGSADEKPAHNITLNSFFLGKYEVTNSEFKKFVDATGYITDAEQPDTVKLKHGLPPRGINNGTWKMYSTGKPVPAADSMNPVANISWNDAVAYCEWLGKETGKKFRLPTEAEWEYAAKGGAKSKNYKYVGGNNLGEVAWYLENSDKRSHTIGKKLPNELDIYDMAGNIREWCSDYYGETYYKISPAENPAGPDRGSHRCIRGGSWGSEEGRMRISYRNNEFPYNSALGFGFRLAITDESAVKKEMPKKEINLMQGFDEKGFIDIYGINFDIGKAIVKAESFPVVEQITTYLKEHPQTRILIEGHTDNTGTDAKNLILSDKRAASIKAEIVKRGVDAGRMETKGFGASKPIADNKTAAGRTQNRRVTIKKL
ncbi:MAG: SUMF1/EgtB/PvdO family nonheme iron enzyme [Bacteroidales bacterium]